LRLSRNGTETPVASKQRRGSLNLGTLSIDSEAAAAR
jgi:hypothetical protein